MLNGQDSRWEPVVAEQLLAQNKTIDSLLFTIEDDDNEFTSEERLTLQNVF